jgi:hypothetical protein
MKREDEIDEMAERSKQLGEEISDAREDWERKKADDSVPGTPPTSETDQDDAREPWPDE